MWPPISKSRAIALRKQGYTQREIRQAIPGLPKATLSYWLRDVTLSVRQQREILRRATSAEERGREMASAVLRAARLHRIQQAEFEAAQEYQQLKRKPLFLCGLMLYWAEGSKAVEIFNFMNSDPRLIRLMIRWIHEMCGISKDHIIASLYMHSVYAAEHPLKYWRKVIGLPRTCYRRTVFKPTPHTVKKNTSYLGCMRIQVNNVHYHRKVMHWIALFAAEQHLGVLRP